MPTLFDVTAKDQDKALIGRIGAHTSWANTPDRSARTAPGRQAFHDSFEDRVDPDGTLEPHIRAQLAESARRAYYSRLALRSVQARRARGACRLEDDKPA